MSNGLGTELGLTLPGNLDWIKLDITILSTIVLSSVFFTGLVFLVCVFGLFIFKVTEPNSIPYGTHSACAKLQYSKTGVQQR